MYKIDITPELLETQRRRSENREARREEFLSAPGLDDAVGLVVQGWFEEFCYRLLLDEPDKAREALRRMIEDGVYALFGEWRVGFKGWDDKLYKDVVWTAETARQHFYPWIDLLRRCLMAASILGDWKAAVRFGAYLDGSPLPRHPEWNNHLESDDAFEYYRQLAGLMAGKGLTIEPGQKLSGKMKRREHALRECLFSLARKDHKRFDESLSEYLRFYWTHERDPEAPYEALCIDGTLLYHLAKRELGHAPEVDPKLRHMVVIV